ECGSPRRRLRPGRGDRDQPRLVLRRLPHRLLLAQPGDAVEAGSPAHPRAGRRRARHVVHPRAPDPPPGGGRARGGRRRRTQGVSRSLAEDRADPYERQSVRRTLTRFGWLRTEVLAGLVVALALIPEAIAFSIIAGVDPRVGLFASFTMAVTTAILGGRPAMISAATGAVALVIAPLSASHGVDHLIAAVILAGVFQVILAVIGAARLMRFIPRQVMVGFVNGLAILVFIAQVPELVDVPWLVYPVCAAGLLIVFL